jgi:dethiobiotin synthetase
LHPAFGCNKIARMRKVKRVIFVTGTDTAVGKTTVSVGLVKHLRATGRDCVGLKPFCTGDRNDAVALQLAAGGAGDLDLINPWFFRNPLTPWLAARLEKKRVLKPAVLAFIRQWAQKKDITVVEGAGGLLSPLGAGYSACDLIEDLQPEVVLVCGNKLGVINHTLLSIRVLSAVTNRRVKVVLSELGPQPADQSAKHNLQILRSLLPAGSVRALPHLTGRNQSSAARVYQWLAGGS